MPQRKSDNIAISIIATVMTIAIFALCIPYYLSYVYLITSANPQQHKLGWFVVAAWTWVLMYISVKKIFKMKKTAEEKTTSTISE